MEQWEYNRIKEQENLGNWSVAAEMWKKADAGYSKDVEACKFIADAIAKRDEFRERIERELGPEPEFTEGNVKVWQNWHRDMNEIHLQMFK